MKFIFVDAENTGLKEVEGIEARISDKVLVYSKSETIKELCERKLFLNISSYPTGQNQADFFIISHLSAIINSMLDNSNSNVAFYLYSQDKALVQAFVFQCDLYKVPYVIALPPKSSEKAIIQKNPQPNNESNVTKLYQIFKIEQTTEQARIKLNLPKSDFTKALNSLIKTDKLKKTSKTKKTWLSVA